MKKKKIIKGFAVYFALSILFQAIAPTVALALTTGPGQPEMQSFEPVGTTEMVDPFSGDFNYNIPLMTVPGPNGGYPINLAYHAGIGMEQEASWVGLGWNVNAGEINREMRGLPDDFNGDVITQKQSMNPNITASLTGKINAELANFDGSIGLSVGASVSLIWNSYKGIGIGIGQGINASVASETAGFGLGLHTDYSSITGQTDLSASLSFSGLAYDRGNQYGVSFTRNSLEGIKSLDFKRNGTEVSFSGSSFIPHADMPQTGFSLMASFDAGADIFTINPYAGGEASVSVNKIAQNSIPLKAYGYLYSQNRNVHDPSQNFALMDVNREKDVTLTKDIPALPMPMYTNDVYLVKGQGIGGAFRPYRSDIGVLQDPVITSNNLGVNVGCEVAVGPPITIKVGFDITLSYSKGYSGPWRDGNSWADLDNSIACGFKSKDVNAPLYEPYYFKNMGDMTANSNEESGRVSSIDEPLPISLSCGISASDFAHPSLSAIEEPIADVRVNNAGQLNYSKFQNRQSRSQLMSLKTLEELAPTSVHTASLLEFPCSTYPLNSFPGQTNVTATPYDYNNGKSKSQTGEITVVNPDGNRYIYGIPAYNISANEVSFSVKGADAIRPASLQNTASNGDRTITYSNQDASPGNIKNAENLFASKTMPAYAHSYLLTAIVSPDYVDLTGDGLTEDDYGYYTKFNYSKLSGDYNWRSPYRDASFMKGFHSSQTDDLAGYAYGIKEIWYLNSIETKTHIAEFTTSDRKDGFGAYNEKNDFVSGGTNNYGQALRKLDQINLYSKKDPSFITANPVPIKTVNFDYTYDLCGGVDNNDGSAVGRTYYQGSTPFIDINANHGKLTLKKVWFTYMGNNKGSLSPYEFDYKERTIINSAGQVGAIDPIENPDYSTMKFDRWGNYKSDSQYNTDGYNNEDPYTLQRDNTAADAETRDKQASAWCLKNILLPSGGQINVTYESDDYGYVQDQGAMQMSKIVAMGNESPNSADINSTPKNTKITGKELIVYFELKNQNPNSHIDVFPYVKGIKDLYFKTFQKLKNYYAGSTLASDYVAGYAKVGGSNADGSCNTTDFGNKYGIITSSSGIKYGWVKLAKVDVHDNHYLAGLDYTNPIRKAGWQYLKLSREDLLAPSNNLSSNPSTAALLGMVTSALGYFASNVQLLTGYYNYCLIAGYCKELNLDTNKPSFIRVNSPDKIKFGGGHRVKTIEETDSWIAGGATPNQYGQEYLYRLSDGSSSGVAEYEPLIGGEEIPLRQPIRYSSEYFIVARHDLYMEYPFCEQYYPAPSVGYSRVIVKGIDHGVTKGTDGVTVYEFYTAKDFPVTVKSSELNNQTHKKFTPDMNIPFIGSVSFENHGFTQSFTVETNDMHGKLHSVSTYPFIPNLNAQTPLPPTVSKVEYIYKTENKYDSNSKNQLNNAVDVLFRDADHKTANVGLTEEHFIDMRERSSVSMVNGGQVNTEAGFPPPWFNFAFIPRVEYSERLNKTVVSMHVINRNGILMQTVQNNEGSKVTTDNLMFDADNGEPLLTTVTNNFDAPVYTYDYAAHWSYEGMGAAYKNTGAEFYVDATGVAPFKFKIKTNLVYVNPLNYLSLGDKVLFNGDISWVTQISSNGFELQDNYGNPVSNAIGNMKIVRSGRRNLQDISDGTIVSLSNPVTARVFPLFIKWNSFKPSVSSIVPDNFNFIDCSGTTIDIKDYVEAVKPNVLQFSGKNCNAEIIFPDGTDLTNIISSNGIDFTTINTYSLQKFGNIVVATESGFPTLTGTWNNPTGCFAECVEGVLHADATEFKDNWSDEIDFIKEDIYNNQNIPISPLVYIGDYSVGKKGIWRTSKTNLYQVDRKQETSTTLPGIAKDGSYNNFELFSWSDATANPNWFTSSNVTRINPFGFEIENKNALGIYSTALYGYSNSLQTAVASNAGYFEIAFDGFEDYPSTGYPFLGPSKGHGHMNLIPTYGTMSSLTTMNAHTGKNSLMVEDGQLTFTTSPASLTDFIPVVGKKYTLTAWVKNQTPAISVTNSTVVSFKYSNAIEGWRRCELTFTPSNNVIEFTFGNAGNGLYYLDDIRIQPYQSTLKTYVYDKEKLWLSAELDDQNYATFYNYNQEGTMFQVKKETEKGIATVRTSQSNIKQKN